MNALVAACKVLNQTVDGIDLFNRVKKIFSYPTNPSRSENVQKTLSIASSSFKSLAFVANSIALGAHMRGASDRTLEAITSSESVIQFLGAFPELLRVRIDYKLGHISIARATLEASAPLISTARAYNESEFYRYKHIRSLPQSERAQEEPIYGEDPLDYSKVIMRDWDNRPIIGWKVGVGISDKDCDDKIKAAEQFFTTLSPAETAVKGSAMVITSLKQNSVQQKEAAANHDTFSVNLVGLAVIPEALHNDVIFRQYECAITHQPIRDPVGDPNGKTLYERNAIVRCINLYHKSPMTNAPLEVNQLVEKPLLKALIDQRLEAYEKLIKTAIEVGGVTGVPPDQMEAVKRENPNY